MSTCERCNHDRPLFTNLSTGKLLCAGCTHAVAEEILQRISEERRKIRYGLTPAMQAYRRLNADSR